MELRLALRCKDEFTGTFNMSNIQNMNIAGQPIGTNYKPYIIAEMSANHNGSIDRAFKIIDEAKKAGADAVKLQTYTPDTITLNCDKEDFQITDGLWKGQTLYELYKDNLMGFIDLCKYNRNILRNLKSLKPKYFNQIVTFYLAHKNFNFDFPFKKKKKNDKQIGRFDGMQINV